MLLPSPRICPRGWSGSDEASGPAPRGSWLLMRHQEGMRVDAQWLLSPSRLSCLDGKSCLPCDGPVQGVVRRFPDHLLPPWDPLGSGLAALRRHLHSRWLGPHLVLGSRKARPRPGVCRSHYSYGDLFSNKPPPGSPIWKTDNSRRGLVKAGVKARVHLAEDLFWAPHFVEKEAEAGGGCRV